ncbi:MAG: HAMP domain-containing protein [Desulfobacteraceae bacterium]|nr:HAMP domain-containing protein [Desulfobacteraceae bacterium]
MRFIHSIKFRFTIWYVVVLGIAMASLSVGTYFYLSRTLYQNLDNSLELRSTQLSNIREILISVAEGQFEEEIGEVVSFYFYSGGQLMSISPREVNIPISTDLIEQAIAGQSIFTTLETSEGVELRLYATPFSLYRPVIVPTRPGMPSPHAPRINIESAVLVIGRPTEDIKQALDRLLHTLMIAVPLTLVATGGGGVFLARRAFKPVDEMTQKARSIEERDLSQRIEVKTKDELGRLASTLNEMIERLEKAFRRQKQFTSDASHELRAPLAIIEAESTLTLQKERTKNNYRQSLETISQEAHRMSLVIDQLLALARADSGKEKLTFRKVNLSRLVAKLSSDVEMLCRDKGLNYELGQMGNLVVKGDRTKLRQLLLNILDNAIRYTPRGGKISISVQPEGEMAVVSVSDTGLGIPPEDLPHIFDRFYRVDKTRSRSEGGSGLGLAIAKRIAEMHGGKIEVESKVGTGSTFRVCLLLYRDV